MMRQLWAIALGLMILTFSVGATPVQTDSNSKRWVTSYLPQGVPIQSATPVQLAAAVKAAIKAHPKQAKEIVAYVFAQFTSFDRAKALAVIDAIISAVPEDEVAGLIKIAIASLSTTVDVQTGQSAYSTLASLAMQEAIGDETGLASAILAAIGSAPAGPGTQFFGPGNVTNPANFSNTTGRVNSPQ